MFNKPLLFSLSTFFILMVFISAIKNNTRNIEKNIEHLNMEISILKKDLLNAEIDFIYLSSPEKLLLLNKKKYSNYDFSRIFLSTQDFINFSSKQTKNLK
tara:strand:+ start:2655 stop:2954 length:300 start_codon:yes stop_codon:yes gene_type:complete